MISVCIQKKLFIRCLERYAEALEVLKQVESMGRNDLWFYVERGYVYSALENYEKARDDYLKALEIEPDHPLVRSRLGWVYANLEQYPMALSYYLSVVDSMVDQAWLNANIGWAYEQLNELKQAESYYLRALEIEPDDEWTQAHLQQIRMEKSGQ